MKTSKKHFDLFKKECEKWIKYFGLTQYQIVFNHKPLEKDVWGDCDVWHESEYAELSLCTNWTGTPLSDMQIRRTAFHEVIELLLSEIVLIGEKRWHFTLQDFIKSTHTVIRTLENTVFKDLNV